MKPLPPEITPEIAEFFRGQFRDARAHVLRDSEAFEAIVRVVERLGRVLDPRSVGLHNLSTVLGHVAESSSMASELPRAFPNFHLGFAKLLELVREGRNAAVHEGALARNVTTHSVQIALILEDALMPIDGTVDEFMVRGPLTAAPWQPVSFVRQTLLAHSFSYLPVRVEEGTNIGWRLISDVSIAKYLRSAETADERKKRLRTLLRNAVGDQLLRLDSPRCVVQGQRVGELLAAVDGLPILVMSETRDELIGIVTAFDLM